MGLKALPIVTVEFADVHLDPDAMIGEEGQAHGIMSLVQSRYYPMLAAANIV